MRPPRVRFVLDLGRDELGKRRRAVFPTQREAEAARASNAIQQRNVGKKARRLSNAVLDDAAAALAILGTCASLEEAATYFMAHRALERPHRPVQGLVDEYVEEMQVHGLRPRRLRGAKRRVA